MPYLALIGKRFGTGAPKVENFVKYRAIAAVFALQRRQHTTVKAKYLAKKNIHRVPNVAMIGLDSILAFLLPHEDHSNTYRSR